MARTFQSESRFDSVDFWVGSDVLLIAGPRGQSSIARSNGRKRAPYVWDAPTVPTNIREAFRPRYTDDELAEASDSLVNKLELERQERISEALLEQDREYFREIENVELFAQGALHLKKALEPILNIGRKVTDGGRRGHERTHGSKEEKARRHANYIAEIEALRNRDPRLSVHAASAIAGKRFGVHAKTIARIYRERTKG